MKISTKGRYGLRFLLDLAVSENGHPVSLRDISSRQNISEKYLWQVIAPLKASGLITSTAGAHGGYELAKPASDITILDVLRVLEGGVDLVPCSPDAHTCERSEACVARTFWKGLETAISGYLKSFTLRQLADEQKKAQKKDAFTYCI